MSFDNSKYHVELNGVPYQVSGYQKSEVSTFIPRLGSGDQNETEFDLLRSKTNQGFEGGSLQRYFNDEKSAFAIERLYPIYDDGTLYPTNAPVTKTDGKLMGSGTSVMTAYLVTKDYMFIAHQSLSAPSNSLRRVDTSGTVQGITLPANISNSARRIESIVIFNNQIWVGTSDGLTMGYMAYTATTLTEVGSGTATECAGGQLIVYRGSLYGIDGSVGATTSSVLRKHTGGTSARTFEVVGDTGVRNHDTTAKMFKYNNRIMIARKDGLWAYDGIQMVDIETTDNYNSQNYMFPVTLKGYLYYFMPDGWYRFNGSLIEKMYDISEIGFPRDVFVGKNRIWFLYPNSSNQSSRYDKSMGYDYSTGDNVDGRIMCFNGKGMYTYARTSTWVKNTATEDFSGQGEIFKGLYFNDYLWISEWYEKTTGNEYYQIDLRELSATGNKIWRLVTSIHDNDFPMVDKSLENVELTLDGNVNADQTITIEYRTGGFDGSTGWTTLGTISTQTNLQEYVFENVPAGISYKQIQFRLSGTTAAEYGIKQFVMRYLVVPDYKNQWTMTFLCYGDDSFAPLLLADGTESTQSVDTLRSNIYTARNSNIPVKFIDIDALDLAEDLTNSETLVDITGIELLKGDRGFFQIDDEIFYWTAKTSTTATTVRGALGSTAATHTTGAKVYPLYRVIVRQIQNERVELTDPSPETASDKTRSSEITLTLQEV